MYLFCLLAYSDLLQPVKDAHPGIGYADLWSLAAVVAVKEMGEYRNIYNSVLAVSAC
jgi:catalase (peroxidase I)